ncbi:MAG: glutamine-hydrolyzing carbamoyl-phosphate synthase small subunit [Gammaproteobacteria bacterium]|nr:glutamine-hydrolyzing carbamoyl-phosphate synthase small subunit [Gammaproteobacteria bacterium]
MASKRRSILSLETGEHFFGVGFGADSEAAGELVFNTSMTGYQEISTDASYDGQIVTLTYPLINNYGTNPLDVESRQPWIAGLIVRELSPTSSNWRASESLDATLSRAGIPGLAGIDTRQLVRILRSGGVRRAVITNVGDGEIPQTTGLEWVMGRAAGIEALLGDLTARANSVLPLSSRRLVENVTTPDRYMFENGPWEPWPAPRIRESRPRIALLDCGVKENIPRSLAIRGCEVSVLPYASAANEISALDPDGVLVANGPGDPEQAEAAVETIGKLIGRYPMAGICLGHQLMGLAIGASTSRLKFGHRGANHPVKDLKSGRVHITSQNHGFQVDAGSVPADGGFYVSHINMNDGSVEGLAHESLPVFSVQYHPEASPGPQDNQYLFERFLDMVERARA